MPGFWKNVFKHQNDHKIDYPTLGKIKYWKIIIGIYLVRYIVCYESSHKTFEASFVEVRQVIAGIKFVIFLTPDKASKNDARNGIEWSGLWCSDAMSGIGFWRHVCRQKASELYTCNQVPKFDKWAFICSLRTHHE